MDKWFPEWPDWLPNWPDWPQPPQGEVKMEGNFYAREVAFQTDGTPVYGPPKVVNLISMSYVGGVPPKPTPPGEGPGNGGPGSEAGTEVKIYSPPEGTEPPADPLAPNYEWMILAYPDRTTAWAQVGPHIQPMKR